jgi:hypothetical protein
VDSPGFLRALVPGAGLVCDAATLAAFYDAPLRGGVARSGRHARRSAAPLHAAVRRAAEGLPEATRLTN